MQLLATNYKLSKDVPGYVITGLSLAPHTLAGGPTVCSFSTPECRSVCLGTTSGLNVLPTAIKAKIARTKLWQSNPVQFKRQLHKAVGRAAIGAALAGKQLAVRLNVYSDIPWEDEFPQLFDDFPHVTFYDYTKRPDREIRPRNYHLTYSYSGTTASSVMARAYLDAGTNVAAVFDTPRLLPLPATWWGRPVVDGDLNDFRPADPPGSIVGLRFKGPRSNLIPLRKFVQRSK